MSDECGAIEDSMTGGADDKGARDSQCSRGCGGDCGENRHVQDFGSWLSRTLSGSALHHLPTKAR